MGDSDRPFLGTEARAAGTVTKRTLRSRYDVIYRNVYMPKGQEITATARAVAAWLWSGRATTVAWLSAAALHRSKWIDAALPAELTRSSARNVDGIVIHRERLDDDEAGVVCAEYRRPLPPVPHTTSVGGTVLRKRSSGLTRWRTRPASNPMTSMSWSSDTAVPGALYNVKAAHTTTKIQKIIESQSQ